MASIRLITSSRRRVASGSGTSSVMANPKIQEMVDLAALDVKRLREAASAPQARQAWTDFLEHANRAINRLEGYSRRTKQLAKYKALVSDEVWASPLTKYMRVARNAHEHGVEDLEMSAPHLDRIVHDNGFILGAPLIMAKGPNGEDVFMSPVGPTTLGRLVLFLGAGASRGAQDGKGNEIPDGIELSRRIVDQYLKPSYHGRDLKTVHGISFDEFDRRLFKPLENVVITTRRNGYGDYLFRT